MIISMSHSCRMPWTVLQNSVRWRIDCPSGDEEEFEKPDQSVDEMNALFEFGLAEKSWK